MQLCFPIIRNYKQNDINLLSHYRKRNRLIIKNIDKVVNTKCDTENEYGKY